MEECVFRAVPLALGALIGARYGRRGLGIAIAFVLQAVIFGAAHANYPGLAGVLAAGRAHRAGDVVGADLPALRPAADDPAAHAVRPRAVLDSAVPDRRAGRRRRSAMLVIGAALVPALVVLGAARCRPARGANCRSRCGTARGSRRCRCAPAPQPVIAPRAMSATRDCIAALAAGARRARVSWRGRSFSVVACRRAGAVDTAAPMPKRRRWPRCAQRGVTPGPEWRRLSTTRAARRRRQSARMARVRVARSGSGRVSVAGRRSRWRRRYGTYALRASTATSPTAPKSGASPLRGDGRVRQVVHVLPEDRAGATLPRERAQAIAEDALRQRLAIEPAVLVLRSARRSAATRAARLDVHVRGSARQTRSGRRGARAGRRRRRRSRGGRPLGVHPGGVAARRGRARRTAPACPLRERGHHRACRDCRARCSR